MLPRPADISRYLIKRSRLDPKRNIFDNMIIFRQTSVWPHHKLFFGGSGPARPGPARRATKGWPGPPGPGPGVWFCDMKTNLDFLKREIKNKSKPTYKSSRKASPPGRVLGGPGQPFVALRAGGPGPGPKKLIFMMRYNSFGIGNATF